MGLSAAIQTLRALPTLVVPTLTMLISVACGAAAPEALQRGAAHGADDATRQYAAFGDELGVDALPATTAKPDDETLLALAACDCADLLLVDIADRMARAPGALPQVLMPPVREQIRSDASLKALLNLPLGLGGLLAGAFASDEEIANKVRTGLADKLTRFTPGGSRLADTVPFRFDGFPRLAGQVTAQIRLDNAAPRWLLILEREGLWQGKAPLAFGDHGWQTLETMRLLVEWNYLFGLEARPDGGVYGGLTLAAEGGDETLAPFDPRKVKTPRYVSGAYDMKAEGDNALDLALKATERWTHVPEAPTLGEQALLWRAAAAAFHRLRPENRSHIATAFDGADALFPKDTHQLPLAFLPGLDVLLHELIVSEERRIHAAIGDDQLASLLDIVRLAAALHEWHGELQDLTKAELEPATATKLTDGLADMLQATQLSVQTVLKDHVGLPEDAEHGLPLLVETGTDARVASAAVAGETLATLVAIERDMLQSPLLRQQILGLYHWYVGDVLTKAAEDSSWSAADTLWARAAITALEGYVDDTEAPWLESARRLLDAETAKLRLTGGT